MSAGTNPTVTHTEAGASTYAPEVFSALLAQYSVVPATDTPGRWLLLEAAHVVGQTRLVPHLKTHILMLGQARQEGDWSEAAGQLFRLALAPLGHVVGRLPIGNSGRSNISAFQPMLVRDDIAAVISKTRQQVST
ncbi:MAG: DUF3703 domain-containing protein [Hylemonella sp.]|jgi:hypothetical protein|uniref:DUF3703 domain-containing protein n=1 Tax=Hylemonella sp. TaxID=2066020 RepID=UPI00391B26C9